MVLVQDFSCEDYRFGVASEKPIVHAEVPNATPPFLGELHVGSGEVKGWKGFGGLGILGLRIGATTYW